MAQIKRRTAFDIDNLFDDLHFVLAPQGELATDVYEDNDNVIVEMQIPGVDENKLDITVADNHLRVAGSREERQEKKEKNFYKREIRYGSFERIITLPAEVNKDEARAEYKSGVLRVILPKKKSASPKKIKVGAQHNHEATHAHEKREGREETGR
jgi:HSP20 family molecular chaperone IbpA